MIELLCRRIMRTAVRSLGATLCVLLLGACATPFNATQQQALNTYLLEWKSGSEATMRVDVANDARRSLLVSTPLSSAGYASSRMVYVEQAHRLNAFARHQWADSPARMLEPLLIEAAQHSGLFQVVTGFDARVPTELRLDTQLLYLRQRFDTQGSEVQLALRVNLIDVKNSRVLAGSVIRVQRPAGEATPYAGVLAANQAVAELLIELQGFLAKTVD